MALKLYGEVALRVDVPDDGLKTEDGARLVVLLTGCLGASEGAVLEVFNALGESICVTSLLASDVEPLSRDEVFAYSPALPGSRWVGRLFLPTV